LFVIARLTSTPPKLVLVFTPSQAANSVAGQIALGQLSDADGSKARVQSTLNYGKQTLLLGPGMSLDTSINPSGRAICGLLKPGQAIKEGSYKHQPLINTGQHPCYQAFDALPFCCSVNAGDYII
jgi:hypothetical protein